MLVKFSSIAHSILASILDVDKQGQLKKIVNAVALAILCSFGSYYIWNHYSSSRKLKPEVKVQPKLLKPVLVKETSSESCSDFDKQMIANPSIISKFSPSGFGLDGRRASSAELDCYLEEKDNEIIDCVSDGEVDEELPVEGMEEYLLYFQSSMPSSRNGSSFSSTGYSSKLELGQYEIF